MPETDESDVESVAPGRYTGCRMERVRLTPPGEKRARGGRARLYVRWMPHLGAEAVALYELLRILPDLGNESPEIEELAELLRSTPEGVEASLEALIEARFVVRRDGWLEVAELPPSAETSERPGEDELPDRDVEVIRAEPAGISADDYFRFMGTLPAPHILEFLNGYCGRDGLTPDAVREALKIASERDARRVGYVRSILERWVERGVKTVEDVERFEQDRKLRLVEQSGAVRGGALKIREGVSGGPDRQSAARRREGYEWLFGETE
jgi:DnaD/phage-associated family protein